MTDTQEEVKPCPFCGGEAKWHQLSLAITRLECSQCAGTNGEAHYWHHRDGAGWRKEAITAWNTRPTEEALRARVEELEGALKDILDQWDTPNWKLQVQTAEIMNRARSILNK